MGGERGERERERQREKEKGEGRRRVWRQGRMKGREGRGRAW